MELGRVKGLGPSKVEALQAAGIDTVEDLAGLDLRRDVEVAGISRDALKSYKQRARALLQKAGQDVPKAPYRRKRGKGSAKQPTRKQEPSKRGWLRRFFRRP